MYSIPDIDITSNTSAASISSIECLANAMGATIIGWNMGDEAQCGMQIQAVPSQATTLAGWDATRPLFYNMTDWILLHGPSRAQRRTTDAFCILWPHEPLRRPGAHPHRRASKTAAKGAGRSQQRAWPRGSANRRCSACCGSVCPLRPPAAL
jgi:hypothetical protein